MPLNSIWSKVEPLLAQVERPSRYLNHEWVAYPGAEYLQNYGSVTAREAAGSSESATKGLDDFNFVMCYPDTYELGQPNQAVRILVNAVNAAPGLRAERAYVPAADMADAMRAAGVPAFSLESCAPLADFDCIGITLPHELAATNICELLDLGGVPVLADARAQDDPIVIAGGPCAYNPEPYAIFFDAIQIGEGEESTPEVLYAIRDARTSGATREQILHKLSQIEGVYVPSLYREKKDPTATFPISYVEPELSGVPSVIGKRVFEGFAASPGFEPMVVPFCECVHDRLNVEILRGCARGCRFCQAGMMYRPVRERSADNICASVREGLRTTGYDEVSLTSLSSTDHSQIEEILRRLNREFAGTGIKISIPSQRLDSFGVDMAGLVAGAKRGGLTFAPEAGTQRLRDVINKGVTERDLLDACRRAVEGGWRQVKLYFMIGLPTERDEDCIGIADLANRALEVMRDVADAGVRGSLKVNVSIAVFVPKSQTPFQWDGQITSEEALRRVHLVKDALKYRAIRATYHDPATSQIEAALSRGGRDVGRVVFDAWTRGARFDAWSEHFDSGAWDAAQAACGVDFAAIAHADLPVDARLPWDHISCGVTREFLLDERRRAFAEQTTPDCTFKNCSVCGVCMDLGVKNELQQARITGEGEGGVA